MDPRFFAVEALLGQMRTFWFDSVPRPAVGGTVVLLEPDGDLITQVNLSPGALEQLLEQSRGRRTYVVATPFSQPGDLEARLRAHGFTPVQEQLIYLFRGQLPPVQPLPAPQWYEVRRRRWAGQPLSITVIGPNQLPLWTEVFYDAFRPRGQTPPEALAEKERAFANLGGRARWYLAWLGNRPAGVAILYLGQGVAQLLSVGTAPACRGVGVARGLVRQACTDFLRLAQPADFLFLDTAPGSAAARLYEGLGFEAAYLRRLYGRT